MGKGGEEREIGEGKGQIEEKNRTTVLRQELRGFLAFIKIFSIQFSLEFLPT